MINLAKAKQEKKLFAINHHFLYNRMKHNLTNCASGILLFLGYLATTEAVSANIAHFKSISDLLAYNADMFITGLFERPGAFLLFAIPAVALHLYARKIERQNSKEIYEIATDPKFEEHLETLKQEAKQKKSVGLKDRMKNILTARTK